MQKVISITKARKLFPDFIPQWQANHPECTDPESVALANPKFATVRHVVVVEIDEDGNSVKALYDKIQVEEGPVDRDFPGAIVVPWFELFENHKWYRFVILIRNERPVRGSNALEFPQGYVEGDESAIRTGIRELMEETGLSIWELPGNRVLEAVKQLKDVCPEPDWFSRAPVIISVKVDAPESFSFLRKQHGLNAFMPGGSFPEIVYLKKEGLYVSVPDNPGLIEEMDSATSIAALGLFLILRPWYFPSWT